MNIWYHCFSQKMLNKSFLATFVVIINITTGRIQQPCVSVLIVVFEDFSGNSHFKTRVWQDKAEEIKHILN